MSNTDLLTTAEVAEMKGVTVRTIARWVDAGRLVPVHRLPGIRGAFLFTAADVSELENA